MTFVHLDRVLAESEPLATRFVDAGFRIYLVGGIVRDLWLDRPVDDELDLDLTTDARPDQIKDIIGSAVEALWLQGERFGTIGARLNGRAYEITTHRSEIYRSDSRKPTVTFSNAIDEDLSRRDFTVNAMAISLPDATLIDPHSGAADLAKLVLQTPLAAAVSFEDDPLRMMRAARFVARYGLTPASDVLAAMTQLAARLDIVSAERIRDEFDKLLAVEDPSSGLALLDTTGLLGRFLAPVAELPDAERARLFQQVSAMAPSKQSRFAALLTAVATDPGPLLSALRHSTERSRWTRWVRTAAQAVIADSVVDAASMRRWWAAVEPNADAAFEVAAALGATGSVGRTQNLAQEMSDDLADLTLPVTGADVMELLGLEPGREIGDVLDHLRDLRLHQGPLTRDQALAAANDWNAAQKR